MLILKDLAVVTATRQEWQGIAAAINHYMSANDFIVPFNRMVSELEMVFTFLQSRLQPYLALTEQEIFDTQFDPLNQQYQETYLDSVSKPRHAADACYEAYLLLVPMREMKTGYPPVRHVLARLDYMVDKYVTNDAWLVMHIDAAIRRLSKFFNEVAALKKVDSEDAFGIYHSLMERIRLYLGLLLV